MNVDDKTSTNLEIFCFMLEEMKNGNLRVTENGLYNDEDNVFLDLVKFDLWDSKTNKPAGHRYIGVIWKKGEEPEKFIPETSLIPGTEDIVDEFYDVLRKKQEELGIEDKWDEIIKNEFEEWKERRDSSK